MGFIPISVTELLRYWLGQSLMVKFDDDGTYSYIGKATPGTATSSSLWQIKRIEDSTGDITWADGDSIFDNVWDNITSLSYS